MRYRTRIGTIPTEDPRSSSWRSIRSIQSARLFPDDYTDEILLKALTSKGCGWTFFYVIFRGPTKDVLCLRVRSTPTTVNCGHGIISHYPRTWVSSRLERQRLVCNRRGHCRGLLSAACLTGLLLDDIVISGNCSIESASSSTSSGDADVMVSARRSFITPWGRCPPVVELVISRKVRWTFRADFIASHFAGSNSDFFLWGRMKEHFYVVPPRTM